jgi:hypothetical protein
MSNVVVVLVLDSIRCPLEPLCGLKKKYWFPLPPEMFPKSKTRAQFPLAPNLAQNSIVTAELPETSPPGRLT